MKKDFKYDIAISLCKQDVGFARELVKAINSCLEVFFYEEKQEELIGKMGLEAFAKAFKVIDKYSHVAKVKEIEENEFNLNIPRYVDTFEEEEIDVKALRSENGELEKELTEVRKQMDVYLDELGF